MFKQSIKSAMKPPCFSLVSQQVVPKIDWNASPDKHGPFKINQIPNSQIAKKQPEAQATLGNDIAQMKNTMN